MEGNIDGSQVATHAAVAHIMPQVEVDRKPNQSPQGTDKRAAVAQLQEQHTASR